MASASSSTRGIRRRSRRSVQRRGVACPASGHDTHGPPAGDEDAPATASQTAPPAPMTTDEKPAKELRKSCRRSRRRCRRSRHRCGRSRRRCRRCGRRLACAPRLGRGWLWSDQGGNSVGEAGVEGARSRGRGRRSIGRGRGRSARNAVGGTCTNSKQSFAGGVAHLLHQQVLKRGQRPTDEPFWPLPRRVGRRGPGRARVAH